VKAIIYRPTKTATQSGKHATKQWRLEFLHDGSRAIEPVMGWVSSSDVLQEVVMEFPDKESAIRFAEKKKIDYELVEPEAGTLKKQAYADNFTK